MPANRSRTVQWRRCLEQLAERNGSIDLAVMRKDARNASSDGALDLVWRVRVLEVGERELLIEPPHALGQTMHLETGVEFIAIMAIGQNRWMFRARNLGLAEFRLSSGKPVPAARLTMPRRVERCQRRNFYRIETAALKLPDVAVWPLLDPKSVVLAERANELQMRIAENDHAAQGTDLAALSDGEPPEHIMPEVGPQFTATLLNIGGGGIGLRVPAAEASHLQRHKLFWMRFSLPPEVPTPICATAKLAHTHLQSGGDVYAGLAFDFSFNPAHQRLVIDQICRYIAIQQRAQLQRATGNAA